MADADAGELTDLLADWLPSQRWYAGKGRPLAGMAVEAEHVLRHGDPELSDAVLRIDYADGGDDRYHLLLGRRAELPQRLTHAAIGEVAGGWVYDAVHDAEVTDSLLRAIADGDRAGLLRFAAEGPTKLDVTLTSRVIGTEQSNTSLVYGDEYILKLFRRIAAGHNPDLELTRALAAVGCEYIAPPLGSIEGVLGGGPVTLGMLAPFFKTGTDGWALATTSVRDLYAEADLHADEVGGDFAAESARLGQATAVVHAQLAAALGSRPATAAETAGRVTQMQDRLAGALEAVPELDRYQDAVRATYDRLTAEGAPVHVQRVHGDYHLGQVLRTDSGWILLDFEGEPARPLAERIAPDSPLRDVAGMLRSFDYAARHLLADHPGEANLEYRATEWADRNREAFCDGYAQGSGHDPRDESLLLRAFELDKAVYEVAYEARHRPSWLPIPLGSIDRLVR